MRSHLNYFNIGPRLLLSFIVLVSLILAGNGLLVWQFHIAGIQSERLNSGNQQVIAVLRLQEELLLFHQRLEELVNSMDAHRLITEAEPLGKTLLEQIQQTRNTVIHLPPVTRVDPAFLPTLDAIAIDLPSQVEALTSLAALGDWEVVRIRLASGMRVMETQIAGLVKSIDQESSEELTNAMASMRDLQRRILTLVPLMAISTFSIAAFFGWAITRRIVELGLEERVGERTRIARELHDTLLQGFQGLMLRLQVVDEMLPPGKAKQELEETLETGDQTIVEARNAVHDLRSRTANMNDLAGAFRVLGQKLATGLSTNFRLMTEGPQRELHPIIRDEIYRIACEALRNAFAHSGAGHIEAEITFGERLFRLRIRDDGAGIPPEVLDRGRSGHFGLGGMRERAKQIGSQLTISSGPEAGTEIELSVKGSIAYNKTARTPGWRLFRWKIG
jgi:signal transduction histidine kinase